MTRYRPLGLRIWDVRVQRLGPHGAQARSHEVIFIPSAMSEADIPKPPNLSAK